MRSHDPFGVGGDDMKSIKKLFCKKELVSPETAIKNLWPELNFSFDEQVGAAKMAYMLSQCSVKCELGDRWWSSRHWEWDHISSLIYSLVDKEAFFKVLESRGYHFKDRP